MVVILAADYPLWWRYPAELGDANLHCRAVIRHDPKSLQGGYREVESGELPRARSNREAGNGQRMTPGR